MRRSKTSVRLEQALDRERTEALRLLRDQLEKIETAHHHVELFQEKLVPQAQQAFEANRFSYESGKASFLDWISAQRNLRDIEAMAREHLADYQVAVAELEAVGRRATYTDRCGNRPRKGVRNEQSHRKNRVRRVVRAVVGHRCLLEARRVNQAGKRRLLHLHDASFGAGEGAWKMSHLLHGSCAGHER